jgi:transcriptional regulator with XRE-family HTH domain
MAPTSSPQRAPTTVWGPIDGRAILASAITQLRLRRGWSQEFLAERAGIHRTCLGSVERGERNVAIDNICRIAWALDVEPADLVTKK